MIRRAILLLPAIMLAACNPQAKQQEASKITWADVPVASCDAEGNKVSPNRVEKQERIELQLPWFANGEHSYTYLGKERGIFAFHGFDLQVETGKGSDVAARALAAGTVDAAIIGGDALVLVDQEGGDIQSLGAIYEETPVSIYSLAEKGIKEPKDLYGKRLGLMPGSNTFTQYDGWANEAADGFNRKLVNQVIVQPAAAPGMILAGKGKAKSVNDNELDALVHYTEFAPLQAKLVLGSNDRVNEIRLSNLGVRIYGMVLAVPHGRFSRVQLYRLKRAVYDSFMCSRKFQKESVDALANANVGAGFNIADGMNKERPYAIAQLTAMIGMACLNRGANCENFLSQNDDYWKSSLDTLTRFRLLKRPIDDLDKIRTRLE